MNTQTMAELYARQGFIDRAIEVYRRILNQEPENASATRRLAELVKMAPQASAGAALATASPAAVSAPTARPIRPDSGSAAIIQRLGGWLRAIQAGRP
jgi:cytochrome c oxidase assembly factor CtaG